MGGGWVVLSFRRASAHTSLESACVLPGFHNRFKLYAMCSLCFINDLATRVTSDEHKKLMDPCATVIHRSLEAVKSPPCTAGSLVPIGRAGAAQVRLATQVTGNNGFQGAAVPSSSCLSERVSTEPQTWLQKLIESCFNIHTEVIIIFLVFKVYKI